MRRKLLLLLVMMVCSTWQAVAQSWDDVAKFTHVLVWNSDSTFTAYKCADQPVVYADATGVILTVNGTQITFPANEARKFTFADDEQLTTIDDVVKKGTYEITQSAIKVDDLEPGTTVAIYDTAGRLVVQKQAANGSTSIDISSLPHNVYVVKAGHINFKFMKR